MSLDAGSQLGPYEIVAPLGAGGMGEVWRARDPKLDREAALKILPPSFAGDPERLARFEREAKVLASLNHPGIAGIYGFHEHDGIRFLAMELVPGDDLADRLKRGPMPLDEALGAARQIAEALEAAHEQGIVHRDLKPANIKMTHGGTVKVLDFGLAKALESSVSSGAGRDSAMSPTITSLGTVAGVILGTAAYMSPEQARGKAVDKRADIWAFGCVLYEMLTGRLAFSGETVSDTMAAVLTRDPDWSALPPSIPSRLTALIKRCVRKDPRERLRDIGDARVELSEIAAGGATADAPPGAAATPRWKAWPVALGGLAVGVAATALAMRGLSRAPAAPAMRVMVQTPDKHKLGPQTTDITMSPDGSTIAFVAVDEAGVARIWLRALDSEKARPLSGTEGATGPFWSPDGRSLAFFADNKLKRISAQGEGLQILCPTPEARGGAWGAADTIVLAPAADGPIMKVPGTGGTPKPVTTLDAAAGEKGHRLPCFLPDGRHFLYAVLPESPDGIRTKVASIDGENGPAVVTAKTVAVFASPGFLVYMGSNGMVAQRFDPQTFKTSGEPRAIPDLDTGTGTFQAANPVTAARDGTLLQHATTLAAEHVETLDRQGKSLGKLPAPSGVYLGRALSPDGRRLAVEYAKPGDPVAPVYMLDLERGIFSRFSFDSEADQAPQWTPDGRRLVWSSDRAGGRDPYWKNADGSGTEERIVDAPGLFNDVDCVSPDGRWLVFASYNSDTADDLWIVDLDGKHEARPLLNSKAYELDATISPDGRWIAYRSDESGEMEIYAQRFPGLGSKIRLTVNGAYRDITKSFIAIHWRKDGREIEYTGPDGRTVMAVPVEPGAELKVGSPTVLFKLPPEVDFAAPAPDGQRFFACVNDETFSGGLIRIVRNWQSAFDGK